MAQSPQGQVLLPRRVIGTARSQTPLTGAETGERVRLDNAVNPNVSITDLRESTNAAANLRNLFEVDGLSSAVMVSMVRMALSGYRLEAYETGSQQFSQAGLLAAEAQIAKWDSVYDYTKGYSDKKSMLSLMETALLEVILTGGVGMELVLDNVRMPTRLQIFPYDTVIWKASGKGGKYPTQRRAKPSPGQDQEVSLDLPTVWVGESLKPANKTYNMSFLAASFKTLFRYESFIEDMQRVLRANGAPRLLVKLDYEKVVQGATAEVRQDAAQMASYLDSVRSDIEGVVKDLAPEDALVFYDLAEIDSVSTEGEKKDYSDMLNVLSGQAASALKANPAILGLRIGGSQNTSSTESLLFMKTASALHTPVEEVMSRAMTLAVRLQGIDVHVKFKFKPIDLRPEHELAAFKSMTQAVILEQLSLGFITDDEAGTLLGTGARAPGAPELSGTMFHKSTPQDTVARSNEDSTGRQLQGDAPNSAGGEDNEARP